jgi:hypothetical protein
VTAESSLLYSRGIALSFNQNDLVRAVARDLGLEHEAERQLGGRGNTRSLSISDVEAIVNLIIKCVEIGLKVYEAIKDRRKLTERLDADTPKPVKVSAMKREEIITRVSEKLTGGSKA